MIGRKFGRLTVIEEVSRNKNKTVLFRCLCDCGNYTIVSSCHLYTGHTKSCGCLSREKTSARFLDHGMSKTRIYRIWNAIRERTSNPNTRSFRDYGGRGIIMCSDWHDFKTFLSWALSNGYEDTLSIDRIDNDGNYCPQNCRWVTRNIQANNTRTNVYLEYNGERHTLAQWAAKLNISKATLWARIHLHKWTIEKALTTPLRSKSDCR